MNKFLTLLLALLLPCCAVAQQKSKNTGKKPSATAKATTKVTNTPSAPAGPVLSALEERMLSGLEKVVIFDSLVVSKRDLFRAYPLSPSAGTLAWADTDTTLPDSLLTLRPACHTIAYGDKRLQACPVDSASAHIELSMRVAGQWTAPEVILSNNDGEKSLMAYPYLMADGQTIYFAQQSTDGLGGLDLYITRQNADRNGYYRPENLGMPFNSSANDYLLVIDEENGYGMFASDRRQKADSVCIYYFIPSELRNTYDDDNLSKEKRLALARINSIADTWAFSDKETLNAMRGKLRHALTSKNSTRR